jgi:hypothetical protein
MDYSGLPFPKRPRILDRIAYKRQREADERACRRTVDQRDGRRCFFPACRAFASEKHHIVPSSVRGKRLWVTSDILSSCPEHHQWFKAGLIRVVGNPDQGPVRVVLTALGLLAGIKVPARKVTR